MRCLFMALAAVALVAGARPALAHNVDGKFGLGYEETLTGVGARQDGQVPELRAAGLAGRYYLGNIGLEAILGATLHLPEGEAAQHTGFLSAGVLYNLFRAPSVNLALSARALFGWARRPLGCPTDAEPQRTCPSTRVGFALEFPLRVEYFFSPAFAIAGAVGPVVGFNDAEGNPLSGERNSRSITLTRGEFSGGLGFTYYIF